MGKKLCRLMKLTYSMNGISYDLKKFSPLSFTKNPRWSGLSGTARPLRFINCGWVLLSHVVERWHHWYQAIVTTKPS